MKRAAIITSSDKGYRGERKDLSGPAIREILEREGYQVVFMDILPDDREMLSGRMAEIADDGLADLILTTGGTGFSPRDVMPEATEDVIDRRVPGIPEAIRAYSMTITKRNAALIQLTFDTAYQKTRTVDRASGRAANFRNGIRRPFFEVQRSDKDAIIGSVKASNTRPKAVIAPMTVTIPRMTSPWGIKTVCPCDMAASSG